MKRFTKTFKISVKDSSSFLNKLDAYLSYYKFSKGVQNYSYYTCFKTGSFFDGWKINPLNFESKIEIENFNTGIASIKVSFDGCYITPYAFADLFEAFIANLDLYVNQDIAYIYNNKKHIKKAKVKMLKYFGFIILGLLVGFLVSKQIANNTAIYVLPFIGIILGAKLSETFLNKRLQTKAN